MHVHRYKYVIAICSLFLMLQQAHAQEKLNLNTLSEEFLGNIKKGKSTNEIRAQLYNVTLEELEESLIKDEQKLAFWINMYNGYIQVILNESPEKYDDRRAFFKNEQIPIAGRLVSFATIEHGIIRKSQWEFGLGYFRKWFPDEFERKLRVDERDYRIHFALNCGAKDCPPVAIYKDDRLDEQLDKGTNVYLTKTSEYKNEKNEIAVTPLFSWFRGDFGSKGGVKDILKKLGIIQNTQVDIVYKPYDWNLDLDNWSDL